MIEEKRPGEMESSEPRSEVEAPETALAPAKKTPRKRARAAKSGKASKRGAMVEKALESSIEERLLILFRHGDAEERGSKPDEERALTGEGHQKMREISKGLGKLVPKVDAIVSSPLVRAVQTSVWIQKACRKGVDIETSRALLPGAPPASLSRLLGSAKGKRIIIVGHEPNLSKNIAALTGVKLGELKKGGCCVIRFDEKGRGQIEAVLSPSILRRARK